MNSGGAQWDDEWVDEREIIGALRSLANMVPGSFNEEADLAAAVLRAARHMTEPLRVAVAGQIKRGKSTLVNAVLGERIVATGQLELTFNVTELAFGNPEKLVVHLKDDGGTKVLKRQDLERLTVRDPAALEMLAHIRKIELCIPNPFLERFRLVDTPGLGSLHVADSANTAAYLGITDPADAEQATEMLSAMHRDASDIHADSIRELDNADAIVMMFSRAVSEADLRAVAEFCGSVASEANRDLTPLRAFGVLSRSDEFWPPGPGVPGRPDPLTYDPMRDAARPIAQSFLEDPRIGRHFYVIEPIAGLLAEGAQTMSSDMFDSLAVLSELEPRLLVRRVRDAGLFAREEFSDVPVPPAHRERLVRELGLWGTFLACRYLRDGLTETQVRQQLVSDSGVARLRHLIANHFGNRATLIKLDRGLNEIAAAVDRCRAAARLGRRLPANEVGDVAAAVEDMRGGIHSFAELKVLAAHYNHALNFQPGWEADLLAVTGEKGVTIPARLGMTDAASVDALLATVEARVQAWARRDGDRALDDATRAAAHTLVLSYERLARRVTSAREILKVTGL
jgi:hypothetical protein